MSTTRLVVISLDALGADDLRDHLHELPHLAQLVATGTHVKTVMGIYPTLTYPSHTTIVTGMWPKHHGIVNNTKRQPQRRSPDWFWYRKAVKVPTIYDLARQANLTTAAFLWPVTAAAQINWNVAEIFPNRIWTNQYLVSFRASSPLFLLHMNAKYGGLRRGIHQPQLDDFITAVTADTLLRHRPNLTLVHLVDMDSMRHRYGVRSPEAMAALKRLDKRVGRLIDATKQAGTFAETNFAILGDHYQIDVTKMIHLNHLFAEQGWLQPNKRGGIRRWQVLAKTADGSTYVYIKEPTLLKKVRDLIGSVNGVTRIYSHSELIKAGADPQAALMVEAQAGYYFTDEVAVTATVECVNPHDIGSPDRYRAVHGYSPQKPDYATTLILNGPDIKSGYEIATARLIDEAPTFARLLGLRFPQPTDGSALDDAFN